MLTKKEFVRKLSYGLGQFGIAVCDLSARVVPLSILYGFANFLGMIGYRLAYKQRKIALASLTMAFGNEKTPAEIQQIARGCFNAMAGSAVEFFMFMRFPERIRQFVEIEGLQNLNNALSKGKGVVALSAHFGSFPLLLSRLALEGYKVHTLLRHMRDESLDKLFEKKRDLMHVGSIYTQPRQQCVIQSLRVLRESEILFVQLDQNFGTGGVFVDFFGTKAATATGPIIFSLRTGAPIVPMFIYRVQGPRHKIVIEPAVEIGEGAPRKEALVHIVAGLTALIERYIRKYPQEWGWIHKRWKARPKEEQATNNSQNGGAR